MIWTECLMRFVLQDYTSEDQVRKEQSQKKSQKSFVRLYWEASIASVPCPKTF